MVKDYKYNRILGIIQITSTNDMNTNTEYIILQNKAAQLVHT